jgi:hypothetical protein
MAIATRVPALHRLIGPPRRRVINAIGVCEEEPAFSGGCIHEFLSWILDIEQPVRRIFFCRDVTAPRRFSLSARRFNSKFCIYGSPSLEPGDNMEIVPIQCNWAL